MAQYNYIDVEHQNLNTLYKKRNGVFDKEDIKQDCDITFKEISDDIKDYLKNAADNIDELFAGVKKPQEILFPKGALKKAFNVYNGYEFAKYINSMAVESMLYIIKNIRKEKSKTIKILEIGAGTGSFSDHIIHLLKDKMSAAPRPRSTARPTPSRAAPRTWTRAPRPLEALRRLKEKSVRALNHA